MKDTNPLRREGRASNTKANMAICNCTCYSLGDNHESGVHLLLIIIHLIKRLTETDNPKKSHRIILWL